MEKIITCPHLTISTPFVNYNDGVRCQMAASQARQAVPLVTNEPPVVETTLERSKIIEPDVIRAKQDCIVIISSTQLIVVRNKDGSYDLFRVSYLYKLPEEGKEYKQGEVLAYKLGYFDEEGNLAQGKNLTCAIIIHPWTYEDSMVLGDHVNLTSYKYHVIEKVIPVSSILLSLDPKRYKILPEIGEKIKAFQPIMLIKQSNPTKILEDPEEVYLNEDAEVIEIDVVGNRWNTDVREYDVAVLDYLQQKEKLARKIDKIIDDTYVKNEIKKYLNLFEYSKFTQKPSHNRNLYTIKYGKNPFDLYIRIVLRSERKIETGDKITNRHASKGTISLITSDMPTLQDGRKVDIIVDLMSIPSRMNIGQIYEIVAGNCIYYLHKKLQDFDNLNEAKKYILEFYKIIDNTEEKWIIQKTEEFLDSINDLNELKQVQLTFPVPPFESCTRKQLFEACCYINPKLKENLYAYFKQEELEELPDLSPLMEIAEFEGKKFYVTAGPIYFYKLVHMAREKLAARGTGKVMKKTMQPTGGRRNQGGQRFGEMEIWCLLAYNALFNLQEIIRLKSDDIHQKVNYLMKQLYDSNLNLRQQELEIVKLFKAYMEMLRVRLDE